MSLSREHLFCVALTMVMLFFSVGCAGIVNQPQMVELNINDSAADIIKKASRVCPSERQMEHHKDEFIGFIHFGPNTFTGVDWGSGKEDPKIFNPSSVDTDQWCRIMKAANMTKVIITVKHHDGYCIWQTKYNKTFSVSQSPWQDGKGDVLRKLAESAKKYGIKVGVYLSPADLYQMESQDGLYGNLSQYQDSIIPTAVETFQTRPLKQRKVAKGLPTFKVMADDYNRYFMNQLYELLTEYGPIHEVWFDGAHPKRKGGQKYIREEWFAMVRKLAPDAVIFGGPDARWVGNEHGGTRESEWNILTVESVKVSGYDRAPDEIATDRMITAKEYDVYGEKFDSNYLYYIIPEVDTSIRPTWFWRNDIDQYVKTPDEIFDIYERSVGGNSVFLLNIPPNQDGKFSPRDEKCLIEVGKRIRATYDKDLSKGAAASVKNLFDSNIDTFWQVDGKTASFTVRLSTEQRINRVILQEAITKAGQRVKQHALDTWVDGKWKQVAEETTIGFKKILRFNSVVTDRFRVRILDARSAPAIATFSAHYYQSPPPSVEMTRAQDGSVSLSVAELKGTGDTEMRIYYTLDGSEPDKNSSLYQTPLKLATGGYLKARTCLGEAYGPIMTVYLGIAKGKWRVSADSSHSPQWDTSKAVDDDPDTFWHTSWKPPIPGHPHAFTVDMGQVETVNGFAYLPRQDKSVPDGMIETGYVEVSVDGKQWSKVMDFKFGNLVNNPNQRMEFFDKSYRVRYFRLTSTSGAAEKPYAAIAELDIFALGTGRSISNEQAISIIPAPVEMEVGQGSFAIVPESIIVVSDETKQVGEYLSRKLSPAMGFELKVKRERFSHPNDNIFLTIKSDLKDIGSEGYKLKVFKDHIEVKAADAAGIFYGCQSLMQLLPEEIFQSTKATGVDWQIPCVTIKDTPRFAWRGMHLDVARHFMPKEFVKKFIDLLAIHKMNTFHWHLTEDQGWRIEIKKYPKLTEVGAWRKETVLGKNTGKYNGKPHGGYYTQDDIKEIVAYAKERFITVVPEIEMPGHCRSALAAYPELSCTGGPFEVKTNWGIEPEVYCAGNNTVIEFQKNILKEVLALFPSKYIHIGGDECPKTRWEKCPKCQSRIKAEGLKNEHELQSWFVKQIDNFLVERGRRLVGWDEILEGGLAPGATVMSWRGEDGGITAAKAGHDAVMAPMSHTYLDHYQADPQKEPYAIGGFLTLEKVYSYDPVPTELSATQKKHILGVQGQLWSEYMPNAKHVEYMAFPRTCALAEVAWSHLGNKDYDNFYQRLKVHLRRLNQMDVGFRHLDPIPKVLGYWKSGQTSEDYKPMMWDLNLHLDDSRAYLLTFSYTSGEHRLDIQSVEILQDGMVIGHDKHSGVTGGSNEANSYTVHIPEFKKSAKYVLRAVVRSDGGVDSNGTIYIMGM